MASTPVEIYAPSGLTVTLKLFPFGSDTIANGGSGTSATEATNAKGKYTATVTQAISGWHTAHIYNGSTLIGVQLLYLEDTTEIFRCQRERDLYVADIQLTIDEANTQDEYSVVWFKNGVLVTSVTSPVIEVIKRADGTDLVASTAMTAVGSFGLLKYDEADNRTTAGEAVEIVCKATIDGSERTWTRVLSRDSSA